MTSKRVKASTDLRINAYAIITRAIEDGAAIGVRRAFKHREEPKGWTDEIAAAVADAIVEAQMNELCEVLNFDHGDGE